MDLASVFFEYCKKGSAVGGAGKNAADGYTMTQREWVSMCKDAKVPVSIGEINDAHRRVDRPTKEEKEELMKKKGTGMGGGSNSGGSVSVLRCLLAPPVASRRRLPSLTAPIRMSRVSQPRKPTRSSNSPNSSRRSSGLLSSSSRRLRVGARPSRQAMAPRGSRGCSTSECYMHRIHSPFRFVRFPRSLSLHLSLSRSLNPCSRPPLLLIQAHAPPAHHSVSAPLRYILPLKSLDTMAELREAMFNDTKVAAT